MKGGEGLPHARLHIAYRRLEGVDLPEMQLEQESVMGADAAPQRFDELGAARLQPPAGHRRLPQTPAKVRHTSPALPIRNNPMKTQLSEYLPGPAEETPPASNNGKRPVPPLMFAAILRDRRIRPGAFRLWHLIFDMSRSKGICWPGIRRIAAEIHVTDESITTWRRKLIDCGYLTAERITKNNAPNSRKLGGFLYSIPDLPGKAVQVNPDGFPRTANAVQDKLDGKERTANPRPDRRDVTDPRSNRSTPQPPEKTLLARCARRIDGEEDGKEGSGNKKPRMTRRATEGRLSEIDSELKTLKARDANYGQRLATETRDAIDWLEKSAADLRTRDPALSRSHAEEAARRLAHAPKVRGEMLPAAKNQLAALRTEQNKLKAWLYGHRP